MDEADVVEVHFPALVAEVRADERDIFPVDAIEGLCGADDGEVFDVHVVGEDARRRWLENFGAGGHAGRVEKIAPERRGIEHRADGEDSWRADEDLTRGDVRRGFGITSR